MLCIKHGAPGGSKVFLITLLPNPITKRDEGDYRKLFKVSLNEWIYLNSLMNLRLSTLLSSGLESLIVVLVGAENGWQALAARR